MSMQEGNEKNAKEQQQQQQQQQHHYSEKLEWQNPQ